MSLPRDHLLRASDIAAGTHRLSELTGLSRLQIELRTLGARDILDLAASGERFLYVLEGSGTVTPDGDGPADDGQADVRQTIATGDFLALEAGECARVKTDSTLTVLTGGISSS